MKALVAVKRVVDFKAPIRVSTDGSGVDTRNVKMSMNPFDEIALEEALRHKEAGTISDIVAVSIGTATCQETLRTALAMGADRAIWININTELQPLITASLLKAIVLKEAPQIVLLGKQAIDSDNNQVGQMLAGLLAWPQATFASKLIFQEDGVTVTREVDGGLETLFLTLPAIITSDLRLNEPRYISLPNIMQAKQKPLVMIEAETLFSGPDVPCHVLRVDPPKKRTAGVRIENAHELVQRLKNEAQVLS